MARSISVWSVRCGQENRPLSSDLWSWWCFRRLRMIIIGSVPWMSCLSRLPEKPWWRPSQSLSRRKRLKCCLRMGYISNAAWLTVSDTWYRAQRDTRRTARNGLWRHRGLTMISRLQRRQRLEQRRSSTTIRPSASLSPVTIQSRSLTEVRTYSRRHRRFRS